MAKSSKPRKKKPSKLSAEEKVVREVTRDLKEAHEKSLEFVVVAKERLDNLEYHVVNDLTTVEGEYKEKALKVIEQAKADYEVLAKKHTDTSESIKTDLKKIDLKNDVEVANFVLQSPVRYAELAEEILNYATNVDTEIRRVELESQGKTQEEIDDILVNEIKQAAKTNEKTLTEDSNKEGEISEAQIVEEITVSNEEEKKE